ncbi:hypothetical protein N1851_003719 [Merluccius polli]|uniref:HAT C-terminal dimerisation domain-containing protein n=1 Tax=Merluccius polli TaxID=89951 RepID=A0AA47PC85_MERPO|nr:hypothetical protein N1851_003719 [Merluccius polli]
MVRKDIVEEVKQSRAFSILADETKDFKKQEQISLVLGTVHESFMHFEHADGLDAAGLTEKIVNSLQNYGLEYREQLVGQGYGCSDERQTQWCVCKDTRLYTFISGSYVHQKWQDIQCTMFQDQPRDLPKLSDVRWACRFYACRNLMDRLPAVLCVLYDIDEENNGDSCVEAHGLHGQIDLNFIGLLATFRRILGDTKFLSDMLQSLSLDLATAVDLIKALQDTCGQKCWTLLSSATLAPRIFPKGSQRLALLFMDLLSHPQLVSETDKDYFRTTVFYPILDTVNAELERHFSKTNCDIMKGIQALNPKSNSFLEETPLFLLGTFYNTNLDDLKFELHQAKWILERKKAAGMKNLTSLLEVTVFLEPFSEVFYELFRLCKMAMALPVSTAACERSFSALIKNHLRTTMNNERLSDLRVLSVESKRAKALDMEEFIRLFSSRHGNRKIQLF